MAHQINFNQQTVKHSFMSVKEKAWHGLGQIIDRYPTSAEAIEFAGLDYIVEKRPLFTHDTNNHLWNNKQANPDIEVPNYFATVRADTEQVLGVVGNDYEVIQNRDSFSFFDAIVGGGDGILYEACGALGNGERIFITAKLPDYIKVGNNDLIEQYLFLTTSHDGFGSITAAFTPIRIVCNNTLNAAMRHHSNAVKIRHTASAVDRLKQANTLMDISAKMAGELEQLFNHWANVRITDAEVKRLISIAMSPSKETLQHLKDGQADKLSTAYTNVIDNVFNYAMGNPTQLSEVTGGTLYGAYNAVTGYYQNVRSFKDNDAKFRSIMDGTAKQRAQIAFDLCDQFARHGADALIFN